MLAPVIAPVLGVLSPLSTCVTVIGAAFAGVAPPSLSPVTANVSFSL